MKNENKVVAAIRAGIIKRLKKFGLPEATFMKVESAVRGRSSESNGALDLSPKIRKQIMDHVHRNGPIVMTGKKALKIFSLERYEAMRKTSRATAKKHSPWMRARQEVAKCPAP